MTIDTEWMNNLNKIEGPKGLQSAIPNDNKDILSRLIKAVNNREGLPDDLDNPKTADEVEAVLFGTQPAHVNERQGILDA